MYRQNPRTNGKNQAIRTAKIQNSDNTKHWQECGATGIFIQYLACPGVYCLF